MNEKSGVSVARRFPNLDVFGAVLTVVGVTVILGALLRGHAWAMIRPDILDQKSPDEAFQTFLSHLYIPTWARMDSLAFGCALSAISVFRPGAWARMTGGPWISLSVGFVILASAAWLDIKPYRLAYSLFGYPTTALGYTFVCLSALGPKNWLESTLQPWARRLADASYAIYLVHMFVIDAVERHGHEHAWSTSVILVSGVGVCGILAFALRIGVELPVLRLRAVVERQRSRECGGRHTQSEAGVR